MSALPWSTGRYGVRVPEGGSIAEQLLACLSAGTVLDLLPSVPRGTCLTVEEMHDWDPRHDLDADLLRDLLLGRLPLVADPRGLRVRGLRIRGRLDLDLVHSPVLLAIHDSLLDEGTPAWVGEECGPWCDGIHLPTPGGLVSHANAALTARGR
jgi:hypothetical protein